MAKPINPIVINLDNYNQAVVGSGQAILTNTDKQNIKKLGGEADNTRTFIEVVDNIFDETIDIMPTEQVGDNLAPPEDFRARVKIQQRLVKSAAGSIPHERVLISNDLKNMVNG